MIDEALIEQGLRTAGDRYDIPAGAFEAIQAQWELPSKDDEGKHRRLARLRQSEHRGRWIAAAAVIVIGLAIGIPLASGTHRTDDLASNDRVGLHSYAGLSGGSAASTKAQSQAGHIGNGAIDGPIAAPTRAPTSVSGTSGTTSSGSATSSAAGGTSPLVGSGSAAGDFHSSSTPTTPDRIVKTGQMYLRTKAADVTSTIGEITKLADQDGGFVESSNTTASTSNPYGRITIRVPVGRFTSLTAAAGHITDATVTSLSTSGKDVTAQYVDLSARLKALDQLRSTYLTILSHAHSIGSTLAVEDRINDTQTQIEQLEGQRKLLANQSALSTLTVNVSTSSTKTPVKKVHQRSGFSKAVHTSTHRFVRGFENIIGIIGPIVLVLLVIGFLLGFGLGAWKLVRRRMV